MFLNGVLFLGLNFLAHWLVHPGPKNSKRKGYAAIIAAVMIFCAQQEYHALLAYGINANKVRGVLMGGFILPVFFISLAWYRIKKKRGPSSP